MLRIVDLVVEARSVVAGMLNQGTRFARNFSSCHERFRWRSCFCFCFQVPTKCLYDTCMGLLSIEGVIPVACHGAASGMILEIAFGLVEVQTGRRRHGEDEFESSGGKEVLVPVLTNENLQIK